jgi:hypothetical protein
MLVLLLWFSITIFACTNPNTPRPSPTHGDVTISSSEIEPDQPIETPTPQISLTVTPSESELSSEQQIVNTEDPQVKSTLPQQDQTTQYTLTAVLEYWNHYLSVEEQITYTNRTSDTLTDLLLLVEPTRYPNVFRLTGLSWEDGSTVQDYAFDLGQLRITLKEPLQPGERLNLSLSYELQLPSPDSAYYGRPVPFGYTPRQTNLVDWYPYIPPYLPGEGWLAHQAGAFGEYLVYEISDFEVNIQLVGSTQDLIIAASAEEQDNGEWHRYLHPSARNFAWSVSHMYEVSQTQVGDTTVLAYAFPIHSSAGERTLQVTAESLALFNLMYALYPRQTLSVVEADFLDGMEFDGMYFLSNGFYNLFNGQSGDYLTAIAAHETAHQWWYARVGNDQALEPWLDEALCTYSERLYFENTSPDALDWWWTFRVNYYEPSGWVDSSIYNPEGYRAYRDAVYLNGAVFMEELRKTVGDESFFAFLQDYADQNTNKIATANDFFAILEEHTTNDLSELISRFFLNR